MPDQAAVAEFDGLFPPRTVTWRLHSEPVLWVAGLRALLLQALHPVAMSGVLGHSGFRDDPWGRLLRTADYVGTVAYGTRAEAARAAARVRGLHRRVSGTDPRTGRPYRADDPELLCWVHCCEVDSFLSVGRRAGVPLDAAEADAYVAEQRQAGALLGLDPAGAPGDVAALQRYFAGMRPQLRVDARTRSTAAYVLLPPMPRRVQALTPARPAWAVVAGLAAASLPGWARRLYGTPPVPGWDTAVTAQLRALRAGLQRLPARYREGPHLRAARARISP